MAAVRKHRRGWKGRKDLRANAVIARGKLLTVGVVAEQSVNGFLRDQI
jgi:hypothetical protein